MLILFFIMRCDFIKEKHLIRAYAIYTAYSNDPQKLNEEFAKAFNNPEIAIKAVTDMIAGGTIQVPPASSYTDTTVNMDMTGNIVMPNTDAENIQASYIGGIGFMRMQSKFRRSLLGASVLNVNSMTYIDPDEIISGHKLNRISENILAYKNKLLRTIASEMGVAFTDITEDVTYQQYTDAVNNILTQFGNYIASHYSSNLEASDAYDSYIILKNFDKLVKNYAPYIKVDNSFENKFEDVNKYSFQPSVKHRHHFSKTDNSDITKQVGNLAETLLKVIPDIDASGNIMPSTIGVSGFNGAIQTLKKAVMYDNVFEGDDGIKFRKSIMGGAATLLDPNNDYNLAAMIQKFIAKQSRRGKNSGFSEFRQTYLHNKLRGIQQYLFADTTPEYIKNSFCQLFLKTEATGYRVYTYDRDTNAFNGKELRSKMYSTQRYAFQSVISGGLKSIMSKTRVAAKGILSKYDINVHTENGHEFIYITNKATKQKAKLSCANLAFTTIETDTPSIINDFMKDVYSYYIPDTYKNCMTNEIGYNWENDFAPFIAIAAKEALCTAGLKYGNYTELNLSNGKVDLTRFNANLNNIGQRLSVIFGDSIRSTIKSLGGNSLPLFGQTSLEYNWRTCLDKAKANTDRAHNMQAESLFWKNENLLLAPQVRSEVELNGQIKDPTRMNFNELNRISILDDFWFPSREGSGLNDAIWLQNATFSDKARHFLVGYKLIPKLEGKHVIDVYGKETSLKEMIDDAVKNGNGKMLEMTRRIRRDKYVAAVSKILSGYAQVYPEWEINSEAIENETDREIKAQLCVAEFNKLDQKLKDSKLSTTDIRNAFIKKGVIFEEHTYAYKPKAEGIGIARVNETMKHYLEAATDKIKWQEMMNFNQVKFGKNLQSLVLSGFDKGSGHQVESLLRDKTINTRLENHNDYYNKATKEYKFVTKEGKLHPVAEAYFAADILLSQEYNSLTIGEIWAHPNKNKTLVDSDGNDRYLEYSEANRLVNQVKRSVIFGSTIHPFGIGTKDEFGYYNGVTSEIDIAIIEDMKGKVFTPLGVDDTVDSQDGSGLCTALQARLENNSEVDAAVGDNKKTIVHSINPETGTATLLKWAVYALTNNVRRNGAGSKANVESLVKRMYDKALGRNDLDLNQIYRDYANKNGQIYIKNRISGEYKELANIQRNADGTYTQIFTDGTIGRTITVNTLYDIDQVFGGAWTYKFDGNNYIGTEASVDLLAAAAIKYDLRDKQIAYAVNSSACKVGATNVNSSDAWTNDAKLSTYKISMQFAGVMMNADHDLEEAEVTEMSQMISALIEDGHYTDLVTNIYSEIGQIALNNSKIQKVIEAAKSGDRDKMAKIVGESLVRSFSTGSKDTIGLAQAFIKRTARELKKNGYSNYNLPFDDPTIWGAVIADVTSTLSKLGIRRKYEGFAGVLNPSHNMTQYYLTPKGAMMFDQFENLCRDVLKTLITIDLNAELIPATGFDGTTHYYTSWADAARNAWMFGATPNPFLQPVTNSHDIDFEDTVVIIRNGILKTVYVDDFATYDALRNLNALDGAKVYKNTASPRNLRGADTKFTVNSEDGTQIGEYSLYDIDSVRVAHYLGEMKIDPSMVSSHISAILQQQEIGKATPKDLADLPKLLLIEKVFKQLAEQGLSLDVDGCNILTQNFLEQLDFGKHRAFTLSRGEALTDNDNDALFGAQECFGGNWGDVKFYASNYETRPAEIIMGRYQMEKLGLSISDNLADIKDAKFFYDKLKAKYNYNNIEPSISELNEDDYVELYDRTLFINGEPILVKVGEISDILRSKLDISINTDANIIGEDVRIGNEIILSDDKGDLNKRFRFEKIQTSSGLISYITVQNAEDLKKLTNSEYFDDIHTDKKEDYAKFDKRLQRMAKDRYTSFKHGIEFVGARIPTQAMQSFMPFRVIAFNDSEQNAVYVPKANTHIEGSDYWMYYV